MDKLRVWGDLLSVSSCEVNERENLHRRSVWWKLTPKSDPKARLATRVIIFTFAQRNAETCTGIAFGELARISNLEGCENWTTNQEKQKNSSLFWHPNRCSTFRKGSLSSSLPQTWNLNVPWDASKTAWDEKQNHQKTSGISVKFSQDARLGRSKGTPPSAKKTNWAILEGPRDPQGAQKLNFLSVIKYH